MSLGATVLLLLGLAVLWQLFRAVRRSRSSRTSRADPVYNLEGTGEYALEIVGESHYQRALERICGGRKRDSVEKLVQASVVLEDENQHDDQAVRIDIDGMTVGYLPRHVARIYRLRLKELGHPRIVGVCNAVIRGGWDRGAHDRGHFGVWLDIPR